MSNDNIVRVNATSNWYSVLGGVQVSTYSEASFGSGVLISPYFMLTAAHVVAWGGDRRWFEDAYISSTYELMPGYDNGTAVATQTATNSAAIFFAGYDPNSPSLQSPQDIALVKLTTPFSSLSGEAVAFFVDKPWTVHANANVSITGYSDPGDAQTEVATSINIGSSANGVMQFTSAGPGHGASGGPVMADVGPNGERAVIGTYNRIPASGPETGLYLKYSYLDAIGPELAQAEAAIDPNDLPKIYIFGSESDVNEEIVGTHRRDVINAGGGDDNLNGEGADDLLLGGAGNDTVYGGGGSDKNYGGAGDDHLTGGAGSDYIDGGENIDTAYYDDADATRTLELSSGGTLPAGTEPDGPGQRFTVTRGSEADVLHSVEKITLSDESDTLKVLADTDLTGRGRRTGPGRARGITELRGHLTNCTINSAVIS